MKCLSVCLLRSLALFALVAIQFSVHANHDSELRVDSTNQNDDQNQKRINPPQLLFSGNLIQREEKRQVIVIPPLFELFAFNTVEGFTTNLSLGFYQKLKGEHFYRLKPAIRYGFGNQHLNAELASRFYYNSKRKAILDISGGRFVDQLNKESNLSAFNNTFYTLNREENFLKIYERSYVELGHSFSPFKDFIVFGRALWEDRDPLQNLPDYSKADQEYTTNDPENKELANTGFSQHSTFEWEIGLSWQHQHNYIRRRGELVSNSPYPMLTLKYIASNPDILGSDLSFQRVSAQLKQNYVSKRLGSAKLLIEVGDFLSIDQLRFVDYKHFNGQRAVYDGFVIGDFKLLDYYLHSTTSFYVQGHFEHQFNPLTKNKPWQPVISANYLSTKETSFYMELGVGVAKFFKEWRVDFVSSWEGNQHDRTGVRLGYVFDN